MASASSRRLSLSRGGFFVIAGPMRSASKPVETAESEQRLALPLPPYCPQCDASGCVKLQQVIQGESVLLSWFCTVCATEWPIKDGEPRFVERRAGAVDRRTKPRKDRRKQA